MNTGAELADDAAARWADALRAVELLAVDPSAVGGIVLRARVGPVRRRWLDRLEAVFAGSPIPRVPVNASDERLFGGLDLAATLNAGRPVAARGVLAGADGGVLLFAMAERLSPGIAARIGGVLDTGELRLEHEIDAVPRAACFGVVALDEGVEADERAPDALRERLALHVDLSAVGSGDADPDAGVAASEDIAAARARLVRVVVDRAALEALCAAAAALGIESLRAPLLAARAARASAALAARDRVADEDVATAARLVLSPRAVTLPLGETETESATDDPRSSSPGDDARRSEAEASSVPEAAGSQPSHAGDAGEADPTAAEVVLEAARARLPADLLDSSAAARTAGRAARIGRSGGQQTGGQRGRPVGVRRGRPGPDARLNVIETLRAAAPWQKLRARGAASAAERVRVYRDDFRVTRFKQRRETATVFAVDASGSAALHRLAEAKGAVELLLADCYARRDQVALVAFRGTGADVLLPPTRSLVRAKRCLAGLPGGGGTPLAAGLDAAFELAAGAARRGATPVVVLLTDGRGNVARDGTSDRERARGEAETAARRVRAAGITALIVDTSPRPRRAAEALAAAMGANYLPLPRADAGRLSSAVKAAAP